MKTREYTSKIRQQQRQGKKNNIVRKEEKKININHTRKQTNRNVKQWKKDKMKKNQKWKTKQ